jgi:hypothetical protein
MSTLGSVHIQGNFLGQVKNARAHLCVDEGGVGRFALFVLIHDLGGIHILDLSPSKRWLFIAALPMKRAITRPWFRPVARIGATGNDEEFLDPNLNVSATQHQENIKARRTGELFFYVNDAILPIPGLWDFFYRNNMGEAEVTIEPR